MSQAVLKKIVEGIVRARSLDSKLKKASKQAAVKAALAKGEDPAKVLVEGIGGRYRKHSQKATHKLDLSPDSLKVEIKKILDAIGLIHGDDYEEEELVALANKSSNEMKKYASNMDKTHIHLEGNSLIIATDGNNYDIARAVLNRALGGTKNASEGVVNFLATSFAKQSAGDKLSKVSLEDVRKQKLYLDVGHLEANISGALKAGIYNALREIPADELRDSIKDVIRLKEEFITLMRTNSVVRQQLLSNYGILDPEDLVKLFDITVDFAKESSEKGFRASLRSELKLDKNVLADVAQKTWVAVGGEFAQYNQIKGAGIEKILANHFLGEGNRFFVMFSRWASGQSIAKGTEGIIPLVVAEGSLSIKEMHGKALWEALKTGKVEPYKSDTPVKIKKSTSPRGSKPKIVKQKPKPFGTIPTPVIRKPKGQFTSLINVVNIINMQLAEKIRQNMGSPRLNYRTGRFAKSATVLPATIDKDGAIRLPYTYMKFPYQTFEPGFAQGTTARDPRTLISQSVREIAQGLVTSRLRIVRA